MDSDTDQLVEATGVVIPLVSRIVRAVLDSGASRLEAETALGLVGMLLPTLPISLVAENAASPDLLDPRSPGRGEIIGTWTARSAQ